MGGGGGVGGVGWWCVRGAAGWPSAAVLAANRAGDGAGWEALKDTAGGSLLLTWRPDGWATWWWWWTGGG